MTKIIKTVKYYSNRKRLVKLGWTNLQERRMRDDVIETFKIINGINNNGRHCFNISPQIENLLLR